MESGNGITLMVIFGLAYLLIGESMLTQLLKLSGATKEVFFFAQQYAGIILVGMPFLIITNMMIDAIVNTILDPIFIFIFHWGIFEAALATILGQFLSFVIAIRYLWRFKTIHFEKTRIKLQLLLCRSYYIIH